LNDPNLALNAKDNECQIECNRVEQQKDSVKVLLLMVPIDCKFDDVGARHGGLGGSLSFFNALAILLLHFLLDQVLL